ncbi:hypothetical protein [Oryza sativa Japonica Group]|uniref:Transposon protein, putative, CACTA, En/Spm sub-class n=1 Tax=Oryza sativa subsp. japonica TaxID=39947 RepID=Q5ZCL6_ORYSJ|nr:hypothetical protein [Oryza sativa Japonica Group]
MADRDEEHILYDTIAEGSSQYWNEGEGNEDPNQYLNEEGNKRARGQRGAAKKIEGRHIITKVDEDGRPSAPAEAAKNFVRHSSWVVRDNVPVSTVYWRRTRARRDNDSFVPDSEKEMLWTTMLETFTLPAGTENIVKQWTLKKMAEQFQSFKGDLYKKYILKGLTPNFDTGQQGQAMMARNKDNAAKKKYHHHLGSGGYSVAMPKWEEMEASLIERGIEPATAKWPDRSKFWYYAHGGMLNPVDGSLVFSDQIREAASRLTDAVVASSQGTFRPDREKDELSLALQTPEHPGRTRGKGVIPWKIGFKEDIHTYRSRMRSKRDTEAKIADLEYRVSSYELSIPSDNRSSCASTGQVGSQSMDAMQTHDETTCPVDEITQRTPCELHIPFKNLSIKITSHHVKVALGMAIPTDPSGTYHCRPIPAGYSRVEVELVEAAYEDLELDYPGEDGETHLRDTSHAIILWRKRAMKKAKIDATKNKEPPYDCSQEELDAYVAGEVKSQLKPRSPEKKIPIDPSVKNFFKGMFTTNKEALQISDYDRTLQRAYHKKSKPVPQLGEQPNQEVELLVTGEDFGITEFIADTGLTVDQLMYKFHERYMEMSAKGREDVLMIHFKDLFDLYQLDALDVSLLSAWILMEIQRARRRRVYDTRFIDPRKINTEMIDKYEKDIEDNLVHLLTQQHFKTYILLPYNTGFHWVLLFFDLDACRVTVYDSMNKEEKIFDKVFKLIDRAWDRFRQLVRGTWKEKLGRRFHFPRIHMRDNLPHKDFITAVQEQLMGFINEEVLNPDGEFYYDGSTIHNVGPSSYDITPASKS